MKPKNNYKPGPKDMVQTPPYGLGPLLPHLPKDRLIWEPAAGMGIMADTLRIHGWTVNATSLETGIDFFDIVVPNLLGDIIVTNPPFSLKYKWLKRCYEFGKPFALLMPTDMIGAATAQRLFAEYGIEIIYFDKRIDFIMPYKRLDGKGSPFPTSWYTWGLNIGKQMTFVKIDKPDKDDILAWWEEWKHFYEPKL